MDYDINMQFEMKEVELVEFPVNFSQFLTFIEDKFYIFNFDLYELFRLRFMCIKIMNKLRQCLICNVKFENKKIN